MFASEPQCAMTGKNTSLIVNDISMQFMLKQERNLKWVHTYSIYVDMFVHSIYVSIL